MKITVTSVLVLLGSLCVAIGPLIINLDTFDDALTPQKLGEFLPIVGAIVLAWLGKSPLVPK